MKRVAALALALLAPGAALAQAPGLSVDEGYSFYDLENHEQSVDGTPKTFWSLKGSLRVSGVTADRSVLRMVIKKGASVLGDVRCETRSRYNRVDLRTTPHLFADNCQDRKQRFAENGEHVVEWHLINGDTDADSLLATHKIMVRTAPNTDVGSMKPWYPHHFIDRHGELLSTVLFHRQAGWDDYLPFPASRPGSSSVDITLSASPEWAAAQVTRSTFLRCSVDGNRVDLKTPYDFGNLRGNRTDEVRVHEGPATYAMSVLPNPAGNNPRVVQDHFVFRRYYLRLPLSFGAARSENTATPMGNHPGRWECEWRNDEGRTLRVFRWTVGPDGRAQPHAEQLQGGLSLAPDAVAIETTIPPGNPLDFRIDSAAIAARAWNGRGLRSDAGRALTRGISTLGVAIPLPQPAAPPVTAATSKAGTKPPKTKR